MGFTNLVDNIQIFANEYCNPLNTVLLIGNENVKEIKEIFDFIFSEVIVVDNYYHEIKMINNLKLI